MAAEDIEPSEVRGPGRGEPRSRCGMRRASVLRAQTTPKRTTDSGGLVW